VRLAKHLAHGGVASRRAAERLVAQGRVTVDGEVVTDPARTVDEGSAVAVDGRPITPEPREVWALNKPLGVVSTARDTYGRRTVIDLVQSTRRLYPVGRLDADSTGLILLSNDGELAERLTHPRYGVERAYRVRVTPPAVAEDALGALRSGVELEDGRTTPARVAVLDDGRLEVAIREGRNRQVRRMCEAVGHRVVDLERVAFGLLRLEEVGGGLRLGRGEARMLTVKELHDLRRSVGLWKNPRP
jgi:23S rRNA pseudouridine2605 synthase